jgi:hypothetical protein
MLSLRSWQCCLRFSRSCSFVELEQAFCAARAAFCRSRLNRVDCVVDLLSELIRSLRVLRSARLIKATTRPCAGNLVSAGSLLTGRR